jgi:hypothetical protein
MITVFYKAINEACKKKVEKRCVVFVSLVAINVRSKE